MFATLAARNGNMVCHDHLGVILAEYQKNLGRNGGFQKWYRRLQQTASIHYDNGNLKKSYATKLRGVGCHESTDHVFIAVAYHCDRILVSEDSDVGKGPKGAEPPHPDALKFLEQDLKMRVYDAQEFCANF